MSSYSAKAFVHYGVHWLRLHSTSFKYRNEFETAPGVYYGYTRKSKPSLGLLLSLDALIVQTSKQLDCRKRITQLMGRINGHNIGLECFNNKDQSPENLKIDCEDILQRISRRISQFKTSFSSNDLADTYWRCENRILFGLNFSIRIMHLEVINGEVWVDGDIISEGHTCGNLLCEAECLLIKFIHDEKM